MFILPKNWTGVEIRNNGDLVYTEFNILPFLKSKNKRGKYLINEEANRVLKNIVTFELLLFFIFIACIEYLISDVLHKIFFSIVIFVLFSVIISYMRNKYINKKFKKLIK